MPRRAALHLGVDTLARLLHLREGLEVTGAEFDQQTNALYVYVAGEGLPEQAPRAHVQFVPLTRLVDWGLQ